MKKHARSIFSLEIHTPSYQLYSVFQDTIWGDNTSFFSKIRLKIEISGIVLKLDGSVIEWNNFSES